MRLSCQICWLSFSRNIFFKKNASSIACRNFSSARMAPENLYVEEKELEDFCVRSLIAAGATEEHARIQSRVLVLADARGHPSHGVNRLEMYVQELQSGDADGKSKPEIVSETPAVACVDGNNGLGMPVGQFCMELAIKKAKEIGIGWVVARNSNHYGIAGYYALLAANEGLIGMSFTNTSPVVYPTRSKKASIGTNPIAVAAPVEEGDHFCLDMATSTVALGKVEVKQRQGKPVPEGWGVDHEGNITLDPTTILAEGGLSPLGGAEETGGYKGYGLAMMVEMFCGILSGANFGNKIPPWRKGRNCPADLGQCFVALNPAMFAGGFPGRMKDFVGQMHNLPSSVEGGVLVPGQPELEAQHKAEETGIPVHPNIVAALNTLAQHLNIPAVKLKK